MSRASGFTAIQLTPGFRRADRLSANEGYVHLGNPQLKAPAGAGKDLLDATPLEPDRRTRVDPCRRGWRDRLFGFKGQRRTARLQRPARVADQGMDRRLHQGDRYQGDLPPGRRHRTGQSAGRRGRGITRRRLPDRELPRHGRSGEGRPVRRPQRRHHRSGSGAVPSGHRQVDGCRGTQHRLRLQQDQAATRSAAEIHAGPGATRVERPLGRGPGQGGLPSHRLGTASAQGRAGHRAVAGRHEDQRGHLQRQHRHHEGRQRR